MTQCLITHSLYTFRYTLRDYTFVLPIYISRELSNQSLLMAATVPTVVGAIWHNLIWGPWQRYQRKISASHLTAIQLHNMREQRETAEMALLLIVNSPAYQQRLEQENSNNGSVFISLRLMRRLSGVGLIIKSAHYRSATNWEHFTDVTVGLQLLVCDSSLCLPAGIGKSGAIGFWDVAPGEEKELSIEYYFRGMKHRVNASELLEIKLPQRIHLAEH